MLCSGQVVWAAGQGVLDFEGQVRGSQLSLEETPPPPPPYCCPYPCPYCTLTPSLPS